MSMPLIRSSRRAIIASLLVAVLGAVTTAPSIVAPSEILEISHKGVHLIGVPPGPRANYDVPVIGARQAVDRIRTALDQLLEKSAYSAAVKKSSRTMAAS